MTRELPCATPEKDVTKASISLIFTRSVKHIWEKPSLRFPGISIYLRLSQSPLVRISSRSHLLQALFRLQEPDSDLYSCLFLNGLYVSSPQVLFTTSKSLDSKSQTPISFFVSATSPVYDPQEFRLQEPDSDLYFFLFLNGLYVSSPQVLFTTSKSLDSKSQTPISWFCICHKSCLRPPRV